MSEKEKSKVFRKKIETSVIQSVKTNVNLADSKVIQDTQGLSAEISARIEKIERRRDTSDIGPIL